MKTARNAQDYQQLDEIEHTLLRPETFIGNTSRASRSALLLTETGIYSSKIEIAEGQEQIALEIIANAADNVGESRQNGIDPGHIEIDIDSDWITVTNYGITFPLEKNENGVYIPQAAFGEFRTSTNYDDTKVRNYMGKNGIGAKATNVFSKEFHIECASDGQLYTQSWSNNMRDMSEPVIEPYDGLGYTSISYFTDFERFDTDCNDEEMIQLITTHAIGVAFCCNIPVYINGYKYDIKTMKDYMKICFPLIDAKSTIHHKGSNYELMVLDTPSNAMTISYVNNILIKNGGVHVDNVYSALLGAVKEKLGKSGEGVRFTKRDLDRKVTIILSCTVDKPRFDGQTKSKLTGPKFKMDIPHNIFNKIKNWQLIESIYSDVTRKLNEKIKKTDGKAKGRVTSISALQEANWAKDPKKRTDAILIVSEGDSASAYPNRYRDLSPHGRDKYGIFGLGGKILNVMNADVMKIVNNKTISALKLALGLKDNTDYTLEKNFKTLRYGQIIAMPDSDNDGKHILGLLILLFASKFPSLLERGDYLKFWRTPIITVTKGKEKERFYTEQSYLDWKESVEDVSKWNHRYFKGLGGSNPEDIKDDYRNPKLVDLYLDEEAMYFIDMAFKKENTKMRKEWLDNYINRLENINVEEYDELPISIFIDNELAPYALESVLRSVPEQSDGLKDSQRKALWATMRKMKKRGAPKIIKTAQIAAYIAEQTGYKHGEKSLEDTIVKMTQDFIGSNNLPYFKGDGEFGTRGKGGKDAAASRYTHLGLQPYMKYIYREIDTRLLEVRVIDEGREQESESLFPIIPMHIVNGVKGVGTGYSTDIPAYDPYAVIEWLRRRIKEEEEIEMIPYYHGFQGDIVMKDGGFSTRGVFSKSGDDIVVSELPIGRWTDDYANFLDYLMEEKEIVDYEDKSTVENPKFIIHGLKGKATMNKLRLITNHSLNNMTVLKRSEDDKVIPITFNDIHDLLEDFFNLRLCKYVERKALHLKELEREEKYLNDKARFIKLILDKKLKIKNRNKKAVADEIESHGLRVEFMKLNLNKLTIEGYNKLRKEADKKRAEREELGDTAVEDIWLRELDELEKHL